MKEFTCKNTPYMKLDAVVGVTGLLQIGLMSIIRVTGRAFKAFPDRKSAIEWLGSQQECVIMEKSMS